MKSEETRKKVKKPWQFYARLFLMVMGAIFTVLVITLVGVLIWLTVTKPYGLNVWKVPGAVMNLNQADSQIDSREDPEDANSRVGDGVDNGTESTRITDPVEGEHPLLNEDEEAFLEDIGVDVQELPTEISPGQEACAVEKLGQKRVDQIIAGDQITMGDFLQASGCFL